MIVPLSDLRTKNVPMIEATMEMAPISSGKATIGRKTAM